MHDNEAGESHGQTLVLLHGMGTGASAWQPQIDALGHVFHVLAPNLPGYGGTPGPFTMEGATEMVAASLRESNGAPAFVCGLSLGALVALELARTHPTSVDRMVLSAGFVSIPEELRAPRLASARAVRGFDVETFRQQVLPGLVSGVPDPHRERALQEIGALTAADVADLLEMEFDARDWIEDLKQPALILCGERDEVNLPLSRELAERLPNGRFEIVPGAGHVANLDAPDAFTDAVTRFLAS